MSDIVPQKCTQFYLTATHSSVRTGCQLLLLHHKNRPGRYMLRDRVFGGVKADRARPRLQEEQNLVLRRRPLGNQGRELTPALMLRLLEGWWQAKSAWARAVN